MTKQLRNTILSCLLFLFIASVSKAQHEFIVAVAPSTGVITKIDSIPGLMWITTTSAFNQTTKKCTVTGRWQFQESHLFTVDAISGHTVSDPILNNNQILNFQYSRTTGVLYGIVSIGITGYLATVDPATGVYTLIHDIPGLNGISGDFTIDEANQRMFIPGGNGLLTIDLATGNILFNTTITQAFFEPRYDNISHNIYGITYQPGPGGNSVFSLCTVDPQNGNVAIVAALPNVAGFLSGGHTTFNENESIYYFPGNYTGEPVSLFAVNVSTGALVSRVTIPTSGDPNYDNLIFFRYDNQSGLLYALFWEAHTVLPITLNKLDAAIQNRYVVCKWQTLQEVNSDHFVIERSDDAIKYMAIGNVAAAGNYSLPLDYSFTDKDAFTSGKTYLYYRLKMVDRDGGFKYSNIARVNLKYESSLHIYPNPVNEKLSVDFISSNNGKAIVSITDPAGRLVYKENISIKKGVNSFSMNTSHLTEGIYILSVNGENNYSMKFIKEKK